MAVAIILAFIGLMSFISNDSLETNMNLSTPEGNNIKSPSKPPLFGDPSESITLPESNSTREGNQNGYRDFGGNFQNFGGFLFNVFQFMIPVLVIISLLVIFSLLRLRTNYHQISYNKSREQLKMSKYRHTNPIRTEILKNYIEISDFLEHKGVDPDFSLTPHEFEYDANEKFEFIRELFEKITQIYEQARFNDMKSLDASLLQEMKHYIDQIKTELNSIQDIET